MTEDEWLTGDDPTRMYNAVRRITTTRQARLLMVGCCRLMAGTLPDPRANLVLEATERCADDPAVEALNEALWFEFVTRPDPHLPQSGPEGEVARAILAAWELAGEYPPASGWEERYASPQAAVASAVLMSLREGPQKVFTGGSGDAVDYCLRAVEAAGSFDSPTADGKVGFRTRAAMAVILRDIFGNPSRGVEFEPDWRMSTVVALANQMYESRDFSPLPILADALADAGCSDAEMLGHCREGGEHHRGCWLIDLVLQKS